MALLDIHVGVTRDATFRAAIDSATTDWTTVHQVRGKTSMWELRNYGYGLGTAEYVSFVDDDDLMLNLDLIKAELEKGTPAFFTNSHVVRGRSARPHYRSDFQWLGPETYLRACPHNPIVVRRDVMVAALEMASKSLMADPKYWKAADLAIGCAIQTLVGWTYNPGTCYQWNIGLDGASLVRPEIYAEAYQFYLKQFGLKP